MYIFQPDRELLQVQLKKNVSYIQGLVLDVGAGEFARYQGIFSAEKYISLDVKISGNTDVLGQAQFLPFSSDTFNAVVCTQVFEHLDQPFLAAKEICRVLKRGSYCLVTVPQSNELHEEPNDFFRYTRFGLEKIFIEAGFKTLSLDQRGGFYTLEAQTITRFVIDQLRLYERKFLGRLLAVPIRIFGQTMIKLDLFDQSKANRKHTIGWTGLFQRT